MPESGTIRDPKLKVSRLIFLYIAYGRPIAIASDGILIPHWAVVCLRKGKSCFTRYGSALKGILRSSFMLKQGRFLYQNIAIALGGLPTPPGICKGVLAKKKEYLPCLLHSSLRFSRLKNSPASLGQLIFYALYVLVK